MNTDKQEYTLLGNAAEPDMQPSDPGKVDLDQYHYFDTKQIVSSLKVTTKGASEARRVLKHNLLSDVCVDWGYPNSPSNSEMVGRISAIAHEGKSEFDVWILFDRQKILDFHCGCDTCHWAYPNEITKMRTRCGYLAALLEFLRNNLPNSNIADATDRATSILLGSYRRKETNLIRAGKTANEGNVQLVPRLIKKGGQLTASFKIGTKRLLLVKDLPAFCENVRTCATDRYGADTVINHQLANFTPEARKWVGFIQRVVQDESDFADRLENAYERSFWFHTPSMPKIGGSLNLFGWRLDSFYELLGERGVEYEDRDALEKVKLTLHAADGNPHISMDIHELQLPKRKDEFHGVTVQGQLPQLFFGSERAYAIEDNHMLRSDAEFMDKIKPLADQIDENGEFFFSVGRNNLSDFYRYFLPQMQDVAKINESDPEKFRSYLPPQVNFTFYLDCEDSTVNCKITARYGDKEYSPLELLGDLSQPLSYNRDAQQEYKIALTARRWLPNLDSKNDELSTDGSTDQMYAMVTDGVSELLELGEVRCTNRFRARQQVQRVKMNVGVSVASGLLNLDITTSDLSREELLDVLESYRRKKTYHQLKNGTFVDLQDQSVEMLGELMDSMHIKPKDFVKGKMHLPLYRTLYLNKMLEENSSVYNKRDSHFRALVKGFKTVDDADFEVPESLADTLRGYQVSGYKWLRTLQTWGFGGILADDMGLGKTLQMISVLLANKQEGKTGTSLIVAPASLVFNWGEEFARFAPQLSILPVTGTQSERAEKIESWDKYDVLVTSYDLLKRDIALYEGKEFACEVIDEAQYIKNHTTAAAKAVKVIQSRSRFALTGTPIENRLSELWSIFDYLMPGFLFAYESFRREMETPIVKNQDEQAMARLQKLTGPFILRRLKDDVLQDLPPKLEEVRYVRLDDKQQKLYDGQVVKMRASLEKQSEDDFSKSKIQILAELTRLRQICCDPALCFEDYHGEAAKVEACVDLIQSAIDGGHRMLLFSQFTTMLDILSGRLDEANIPYYTITGATPKEQRLNLVKQFNAGDVPVFLISLKAGGVGLNLTGADVVIHYDPWWNVAAQNQATDRTHRIGQTKRVTVYKLIVKNSVEEKILKLQQTKQDLAEQVIGGENAHIGSLSRDDILELLDA